MTTRVRKIVSGIAVVTIVAAASIGVARLTFTGNINEDIDTLLATGAMAEIVIVTEEDLVDLPTPIQRWLHWSGVVGKPIPTTVRLHQEGELRIGNFGWLPFTAQEYYSTNPPAFLWTARVRLAPGVSVLGFDRYVDGQGALDMRLVGAFPVASDAGPAMDQADLLRYLNEIMWFPAAAISPFIAFEPIDDHNARATITHAGITGSAVFTFDDQGRPTNMTADRFDRESGAVVAWSTPLSEYGEFQGVRIPIAGEGVYARPDGDFSYIRLHITRVEYDVPDRFQD